MNFAGVTAQFFTNSNQQIGILQSNLAQDAKQTTPVNFAGVTAQFLTSSNQQIKILSTRFFYFGIR